MICRWLRRLFGSRQALPSTDIVSTFRERYARFKELLAANAELSRIIVDIEEKLQGRQLFGMAYVRSRATSAIFHTRRMIDSLNALSGNKHGRLYERLEAIETRLREELGGRTEVPVAGWILPFSRIRREMVDQVGGKSANLGEVANRTGLPVPDGFAITTLGCAHFLAETGLIDLIRETMEHELNDPESIHQASEELQRRIAEAPLPHDLSEAILAEYDALVDRVRAQTPDFAGGVSIRSSALGEDSGATHAGQYLTLLNVRRDGILDAYRRVVASLFNPWAVTYRLQMGLRDDDPVMGVACLQMLEPVASGVAFSRHPFSELEDVAIVNAVWGLGPMAVDGTISSDIYTVSRDDDATILRAQVSSKPFMLTGGVEGGLEETAVPGDQQESSSVSAEQVLEISRFAIALEKHFGSPQDVEWAIERSGRIFVLQSRPLRLEPRHGPESEGRLARIGQHPLLLEGGAVAFPGIGIGPVYQVRSNDDLKGFPDGAVLVAKHPSPGFVLAMRKARAIVTDTGSALGHMASLCREFQVPTFLDTRNATEVLKPGMMVTVDAYSGRVYEGSVDELVDMRPVETPFMKETQVNEALTRVAELIVPLRLINPRAPEFTPASCRSLHDIMRFVHESSYAAMFRLSDLLSRSEGGAVKLIAPVPLDLYLIDLGGGLNMSGSTSRVTVDRIASIPFQALLKGMLHEDLQVRGPRPIHLGGLLSVMSEQMLTPPGSGGERFGDRSYAIISDRYLHFSSRIGYHYSILDSYCDDAGRKSYITFSFQGGAADEVRRARRARAIAQVLKESGFSVDTKADRVEARLKRADPAALLEKLDMLGRLLQFTRQLDMLMHDESSVQTTATAFLEGRYQLEGSARPPAV